PTRCESRCARATAMTTESASSVVAAPAQRAVSMARRGDGRILPLVTVLTIIGVFWYLGAIGLNAPQVRDQLNRTGQPWTTADLIEGTWSRGGGGVPGAG